MILHLSLTGNMKMTILLIMYIVLFCSPSISNAGSDYTFNRTVVAYQDYTLRLVAQNALTPNNSNIEHEFSRTCLWLKRNTWVDYCMQYKGHQNLLFKIYKKKR